MDDICKIAPGMTVPRMTAVMQVTDTSGLGRFKLAISKEYARTKENKKRADEVKISDTIRDVEVKISDTINIIKPQLEEAAIRMEAKPKEVVSENEEKQPVIKKKVPEVVSVGRSELRGE